MVTLTCRPCLVLLALLFAAAAAAQDRRGPFVAPPKSVRTRTFDTRHIRLELAFNWDRQEMKGRAIELIAPFSPIKQLEFDAVRLGVERVALVDGSTGGEERPLEFRENPATLSVTLDREYVPGETLAVAIDYRVVEPEAGAHFVVPDEQEPGQPRIVWTQSQPDDARRWFPCVDSPVERVTSEILATVPDGYLVVSNGVVRDKKSNNDGTTTWHWVQEQTHSPYLMSVVAGQFAAYEQSWDGIPVVSYVPPGREAEAAVTFGETPEMMRHFSEKLGYRYPWPKYAQICCDEYGGGMEHTSATTLTLRTLHGERAHLDATSDNLVSHELIHQWFGDLVTCKDWAELWLNESFATYFATLWTEHDLGWDEAAWERHGEALEYMGEDRRYRRPIVTYRYPESERMFDSHSYPKGGRVLHMLRFTLGDELFWKSLGNYLKKHEFSPVETADLRAAIEESTGQGLNWFFDQWLYHGGHPEFEVTYTWDDAKKDLALVVKQTQTVNDLTPLFRTPVEIDLVTAGGARTERIEVSQAEETHHFTLDGPPVRVVFDPNDWILKTLKFTKSKQELLDQLAHDTHVMPRIQAIEGLAQFRPAKDVQVALATAAQNDAFWAVRQKAVEALVPYGGDEVREALKPIARGDTKSAVRIAALEGLSGFTEPGTAAVLREAIAQDQSYRAIAAALTSLAKVDPAGAQADLLAALDDESHQEVVLQAACRGLVDLKVEGAKEMLLALIASPSGPERRLAVLGPLAKLGQDDREVVARIVQELDDSRSYVQRTAVVALADTGSPAALDELLKFKEKSLHRRVARAVDEAIEKLRSTSSLDKLQKEVEALRQENDKLEERIKSLEGKG